MRVYESSHCTTGGNRQSNMNSDLSPCVSCVRRDEDGDIAAAKAGAGAALRVGSDAVHRTDTGKMSVRRRKLGKKYAEFRNLEL